MLSALHAEILTYLATKLPGVHVEAYTPDFRTRRHMNLPALLIELDTIEPFSDFGNSRDRSRVYLNFAARVLVDPNLPTGWVDLKEFAAIAWWALRDWTPQTTNVGPINLKHAGEDFFKPGLEGFMVWLIEWEQEAWLDFNPDVVEPLVSKITANDNLGNSTEVTG